MCIYFFNDPKEHTNWLPEKKCFWRHLLLHPSVHLPHFYHRGQNVVPGLLLLHDGIGKHTAIPANVLEGLGKISLFVP
jgi:hypothetical protein